MRVGSDPSTGSDQQHCKRGNTSGITNRTYFGSKTISGSFALSINSALLAREENVFCLEEKETRGREVRRLGGHQTQRLQQLTHAPQCQDGGKVVNGTPAVREETRLHDEAAEDTVKGTARGDREVLV